MSTTIIRYNTYLFKNIRKFINKRVYSSLLCTLLHIYNINQTLSGCTTNIILLHTCNTVTLHAYMMLNQKFDYKSANFSCLIPIKCYDYAIYIYACILLMADSTFEWYHSFRV